VVVVGGSCEIFVIQLEIFTNSLILPSQQITGVYSVKTIKIIFIIIENNSQ